MTLDRACEIRISHGKAIPLTSNIQTLATLSSLRRRWLTGLAVLVAASWLATGCSFTDVFSTGSDDDSPPRATATPTASYQPGDRHGPELRHRYVMTPPSGEYDPDLAAPSQADKLLAAAAERWSETDTVHFDLTIEGSTHLDENESIELKSAEGDLKRPDEVQSEASVQIGFASFDVGMIVIGDDAYMTNFLTGDWERAPSNFAFNPALLFHDDRGIGAVLENMSNVEVGDESTVNGTRAIEISGTVEQRDISHLVAGSLEGDEIHVTLWIDAESSDLLQISLSEPDDADGDPTTWNIAFSDHNDSVTIEEPDL